MVLQWKILGFRNYKLENLPRPGVSISEAWMIWELSWNLVGSRHCPNDLIGDKWAGEIAIVPKLVKGLVERPEKPAKIIF